MLKSSLKIRFLNVLNTTVLTFVLILVINQLIENVVYSNLLKLKSSWFLAIGTGMLRICSNVYQNSLRKINSLAHATQKSPNFDKPLPLSSFVSHRISKAARFLDKLKPIRNGLSKKKSNKSHGWILDTRRKNISYTSKSFEFILNWKSFALSWHSFIQSTEVWKNSMFLIHQTWIKMVYILRRTILNLMIILLMMTFFVRIMMINHFCLIRKHTYLQNSMTIIITALDQNLFLKISNINQGRQSFNASTNLLIPLILPTLILCMILLRHWLTNQTRLCISTSRKLPIEMLEPNVIYDHYQEKFIVSSIHHLPLWIHIHFSKVKFSEVI